MVHISPQYAGVGLKVHFIDRLIATIVLPICREARHKGGKYIVHFVEASYYVDLS